MKLFTIGPVEMFPYTVEESGKPLPYFRTPEFSHSVLHCAQMLKEFAHAQDEDEVIFLTCSGTGAMEATVINCLTKEDKVLIIDGGSFGARFVQLAELHGIPHDVITIRGEDTLTEEILADYQGNDYAALLVNIDETSTAQLYSIEMLSDFCKRKRMYFIVDAISSFLLDEINFSKLQIDAMIVSSQKALALAPGLSFVIVSQRMLTERVAHIDSGNMYLDFKDHILNGKRGQTPFTPAVGVILQMEDRLEHIQAEGVDAVIQRAAEVAEDFRERIDQLPKDIIRLPDYPMSNACTALYFDGGNAKDVYETLRKEYDLVLTPSGGAMENKLLRVGHLGNHTIADNIELITALKEVLNIQ